MSLKRWWLETQLKCWLPAARANAVRGLKQFNDDRTLKLLLLAGATETNPAVGKRIEEVLAGWRPGSAFLVSDGDLAPFLDLVVGSGKAVRGMLLKTKAVWALKLLLIAHSMAKESSVRDDIEKTLGDWPANDFFLVGSEQRECLIRLLTDGARNVRQVLGELKAEWAGKALLLAYAHETNPEVCREIEKALHAWRNRNRFYFQGQDRDQYEVLLLDSDPVVRRGCAKAFGNVASSKFEKGWRGQGGYSNAFSWVNVFLLTRSLLAFLQDELPSVRMAVAQGLGRLGEFQEWSSKKHPVRKDDLTGQFTAELIQAVVAALQPLLEDDDRAVKGTAAIALARLGELNAVAGLKDENPFVRTQVAIAFGENGGVEALNPLMACLADVDQSVKLAAAKLLGQLDDLRAVGPLLSALKDSDECVRNEVGNALAQLGQLECRKAQLILRLFEELKEAEPSERFAFARALGKLGDTRVVEQLVAGLKGRNFSQWDNLSLLRALCKKLAGHGDPRALESWLELIRRGHQEIVSPTELTDFLERFGQNLSETALRELALLRDIHEVRVHRGRTGSACYGEPAWVSEHEETVLTHGFGHVRQLARQELIRRGLPA